jgi:hypothetical protein
MIGMPAKAVCDFLPGAVTGSLGEKRNRDGVRVCRVSIVTVKRVPTLSVFRFACRHHAARTS